jgi:signal transduction histidine kinase/ActR/RegA family two-component response regulator
MPDQETPYRSSPSQEVSEARLRDANEQLTLRALQSLQQAEELARRSSDLNAINEVLLLKQQQLRSLASELTLAEHRERKRLAMELHDFLAQMLVLGRLKIAQVRPHITAADSMVMHVIDDIEDIFSKSLVYTRTLMAELSPSVLHEMGLPLALKWLAEQMGKHGLVVDVHLSQKQVLLPNDQAILLFQSIRELLLNVIKHAQTTHARVSCSVNDDTLVLSVHDHGRGFDPASLQGRTTGEHFGLFSIQQRMEAMGGSLYKESVLGHGTRVTLTLPLTRTPDSASVSASATIKPEIRGTSANTITFRERRVLLVDDHAMVRQGLRAILEGYSDVSVIGEAANGVEAISMAAEISPDVIIMDINMPRMDGIEATKHITAAQPAITIIGLSVNDSPHVREAMKEAGAVAFISKEAAAEQLYDVIIGHTHRGVGLT